MIVYLATKTQFRADILSNRIEETYLLSTQDAACASVPQQAIPFIRDFIKDPYVLEFLGPPAELSRTPDEEGNEHQAWFDRDSVFTA
jgi:hypothetical protein